MACYWEQNILIYGDLIQDLTNPAIAATPQALRFEEDTQGVLRTIAANPVGRILIDCINKLPWETTIRPLIRAADSTVLMILANAASATTVCDEGINVIISYDLHSRSNQTADYGNHVQPDAILFHELVHALRLHRGLWNMKKIRGFDNVEDFYSIMLTNIYLSQNIRNQDMQCAHRQPFADPADGGLKPQTDTEFYTSHSPEIDQLFERMPDLCVPISRLADGWNPLRARLKGNQGEPMFPARCDRAA